LNWAAGSLAPPKPLSPVEFALRLGCALLCGAVIGVERQWRQRTAGLRTYTLVAVGSALFVMLATLTPGDSSPTRIAGQIVTGIGFLGAGVIMRSGLTVRGLNTAGTIWCSSGLRQLTWGDAQDTVAGCAEHLRRGGRLLIRGMAFGFKPGLALATLALPLAVAAQNAFFTPGNLAVLRVGDNSQALTGSGNTVYIDQFTPSGTLVTSVAVPDAGDSALLVSGTASSEGGLARSLDRTLLTFAGYHAGRGTVIGSLANQTGLAVPRGLATVSAQGVYTLMQTSSTVYSGNNIRGAAADGTNNFWTAGTPKGTYWFHPPETPVNVQVSGGNTIAVRALGGGLYFSTQKGVGGIYAFQGGGLPEAGTPTNLLFATGSGSQPAGFGLSPGLTVAYVADERTSSGGGIEKWTNGLGTWGLAYTLSTGAGRGAYGVAVDFSGPEPVVYATTVDSSSSNTNRLVSLVDTGPEAVPAVLAVSGATAFRGLDFVPDLRPVILAQPQSQVVNYGSEASLSVTAASVFAFGYQWQKNGANISGATGPSLALPDVQAADEAGYRVVVTNQYGAVTSGVASLTVQVVLAPPQATDFLISALSRGSLAGWTACWTNAFAAGVCTVESAATPNGPWLPLLASFTTGAAGQAELTVPPQTTFYRLLAVDISAADPGGFSNLTRSYGKLRTVAGSGKDGGVDGVNYWSASFEGGFATNAALSRPHIALADQSGNLFIVDKNSHSVLQLTPDGRIHTVAGTHGSGNGPNAPTPGTNVALSFPNGLWLGGDGAVYVLDTGNAKVRWLDTNGVLTTLFTDDQGITTGRGLWVKDDRTLAYFSDGQNVERWTPAGGIETVNNPGFSFNDLGNFVVDAAGGLIVTDRGANKVYLLPTSGANAGNPTPLFGNGGTHAVVDGTLASTNGLNQVRGVWPVPTGGCLLGTDEGSQVLYVDAAGILHIFVNGHAGSHSGDGQWFYSPGYKVSEVRSVTMDAQGNIFIVENDAGYVRRVDFLRLTP